MFKPSTLCSSIIIHHQIMHLPGSVMCVFACTHCNAMHCVANGHLIAQIVWRKIFGIRFLIPTPTDAPSGLQSESHANLIQKHLEKN